MGSLEEIVAKYSEPETINDASQLLSALCVSPLEGNDYFGATFPSPGAFAVFLTHHPNYLGKVKSSFRDVEFSAFWVDFLRDIQIYPVRDMKPGGVSNALEFLESLRPAMTLLAKGEISLPVWEISDIEADSPDMQKHMLTLDIRSMLDREPQVETYHLGDFKKDRVLKARVDDLFTSGSHTFLMNSSGTGKSRLLLEGLCGKWGLYLPSVVDSSRLGTYSMENGFRTRIPRHVGFRRELPEPTSLAFQPMLAYNIRVARNYFSDVILAHLLVLRTFLEISLESSRELTHSHKRQWLILQLHRAALDPGIDIFHEVLHEHISVCPRSEVSEALSQVWKDVQRLCGADSGGFFVALDEANYPARLLLEAFRDDTGNYPILKELLREWNEVLPGATFVVAGTDIPREFFPGEEWSAWRWSSNTGAFDDLDSQRRYLIQFLPPSLLESETGKELLDRLWEWSRHRHRFTAAFVRILLQSHFKTAHRLLREFIKVLTRHKLPEGWDALDGPTPFKRVPMHFGEFTAIFDVCRKDTLICAAVHEVLVHYLVTSQHPSYYDAKRANMVRFGMGRFVDTRMSQIAMDDTYMIVAGAVWFQDPDEPAKGRPKGVFDYDNFIRLFQHPSDPPYRSGALMVWFFARAFAVGKQRLNMLFHFATPGRPKPNWWGKGVQLVEFRRESNDVTHDVVTASALSSEAPPLAFNARSLADVASWLRHERDAAFCLCPPGCGADGIFALKFSNGKFAWVVWRTSGAGSDQPPSEQVVDDLEHLIPSMMFSNTYPDATEDLMSAFSQLLNPFTNQMPILRVIASFPTELHFADVLPSRTPAGKPPIAVLKVESFRQILDEAIPSEITQGIVSSVLGKRKLVVEEAESPRKRKSRKRKRKTTSSELPARQTRSRLVRATS